jgi:hypothetical protein
LSIVRTERTANFTVIPNEILNDPDLTDTQLALLVYLLSKKPDWNVYTTQIASMKRFGGVNKVCRNLKSLREIGYVELNRLRNGSTEWVIRDWRPLDTPQHQNPHVQNPNVGFGYLIKTNNSKDSLSVNNCPSRFDEFYTAYPRHCARKVAEAAWIKGKCDENSDPIMADVRRRLAGEWKNWRNQTDEQKKSTLYPATYLNQERRT